ncbi:hypothetical protein HU200_028621 [Digitaria exilis]|uniref:Flavodoxin-like domain-containing protein n=1 Tax=Digitaria exilis TaxID=1010633 RepID=A0A835BUS9_9POAL|nr:hypothetical protein HU200_028621 [Digitaria exilis]
MSPECCNVLRSPESRLCYRTNLLYNTGFPLPAFLAQRYYSTYGHVATLAEEIKKGAASVAGVEVNLWQVPETLSGEALAKMSARPKRDHPRGAP